MQSKFIVMLSLQDTYTNTVFSLDSICDRAAVTQDDPDPDIGAGGQKITTGTDATSPRNTCGTGTSTLTTNPPNDDDELNFAFSTAARGILSDAVIDYSKNPNRPATAGMHCKSIVLV